MLGLRNLVSASLRIQSTIYRRTSALCEIKKTTGSSIKEVVCIEERVRIFSNIKPIVHFKERRA
jgi:hypothetical protein